MIGSRLPHAVLAHGYWRPCARGVAELGGGIALCLSVTRCASKRGSAEFFCAQLI